MKRKKEKLEQVKEKVTHTQVLHHRLIEDIDFVKKHKPLVKEKLEMETEIMSKIKAAQIEVLSITVLIVQDLKSSKRACVCPVSNMTHAFSRIVL